LQARNAARSLPLYRSRGLHLRLPAGGRKIVYPYIRKNGSSKQWLADSLPPPGLDEPLIDAIAWEYSVSFDWELADTERLLILRDPVERAASLFRNKLVQRTGANDIIENIRQLCGLDADTMSFRDFVNVYIGNYGRNMRRLRSSMDPHCITQYSHLWPVRYDRVILLKQLPAAARDLFGQDVAERYFQEPTNRSSVNLDDRPAGDESCAELIADFARRDVLPSNAALVDEETAATIRAVYEVDYTLIRQAFEAR
jgi:hypothetical protein